MTRLSFECRGCDFKVFTRQRENILDAAALVNDHERAEHHGAFAEGDILRTAYRIIGNLGRN